jgi:hypothetical protein
MALLYYNPFTHTIIQTRHILNITDLQSFDLHSHEAASALHLPVTVDTQFRSSLQQHLHRTHSREWRNTVF